MTTQRSCKYSCFYSDVFESDVIMFDDFLTRHFYNMRCEIEYFLSEYDPKETAGFYPAVFRCDYILLFDAVVPL